MKLILGDRIIKLKWSGMRSRIHVHVVHGVPSHFCWELTKWTSCENDFVRLVSLSRGTSFLVRKISSKSFACVWKPVARPPPPLPGKMVIKPLRYKVWKDQKSCCPLFFYEARKSSLQYHHSAISLIGNVYLHQHRWYFVHVYQPGTNWILCTAADQSEKIVLYHCLRCFFKFLNSINDQFPQNYNKRKKKQH